MIKNNYFKYILIIITFSLILFLSACSEKKKNYELYTSLMDELSEIDNDITSSEYYTNYFYYYVSDMPNSFNVDKSNLYDYKDCIIKNDFSYIEQQTRELHKADNSYNYYSVKNNDIYLVEKIKGSSRYRENYVYLNEDEKVYNFTKMEDYTLKDIFGFYDVNDLRINSYNGENGNIKTEKREFSNYTDIFILEMKYSKIKDEPLIKEFLKLEQFNYTKPYITDDTIFSLKYYINKETNDYEFEFEYACLIEDNKINSKIRYYKSRHEMNNIIFDFQQQKNIDMYEEQKLNLLPKGKETFGFIPRYSGYYDITINLSKPVNVTIGDEEYSGSNLVITKLLNSNETYLINIENQEEYSEGNIIITYSNKVNMDNISIRGNDEFVIKLDKIEGFKNILTNNDDVLIENFFYDNKYFYSQSDSFKPASKCSFYFEEKDYFILLKNNSNNDIDNISISINDIDEIKIGCINEINLFDNNTYFKINNEVGGQYKVTFYENDEETDVSFGLKTKSNYSLPISYYNVISMDDGKTYYLSLWKYSDALFKVDIQKEEDEYQWEITGGKYSSYRTFEEEIELEAGYTYNIKYIKNGEVENVKFYGKFGLSNHEYKTRLEISENGELIIPYEILDEIFNFIKIYPKYNNKIGSPSFTICPI